MGHRAFVIWNENDEWYYYYSHWGALNLHNVDYLETPKPPNKNDAQIHKIGNDKKLEEFIDTEVNVFIEAVWINDEAYLPIVVWDEDDENIVLLLQCEDGIDYEINTKIKMAILDFKRIMLRMFSKEMAKVLTIFFTVELVIGRPMFKLSRKKLGELEKKYYDKLIDFYYSESDEFKKMVKRLAIIEKLSD